MKIIPLIHLKKGKMIGPKHSDNFSLTDLLERYKDDDLYILDQDGIEKNKPNLCIYQKLSKAHELWIDAGPRTLGDVVDSVIAGATTITIRRELWKDAGISGIKEIIENKIYADVNLKNYGKSMTDSSLISDIDGLIIFDKKNQIEDNFKSSGYLKDICKEYKTYAYEPKKKNATYWKKLGVTGLLIDIKKAEEFSKNDF